MAEFATELGRQMWQHLDGALDLLTNRDIALYGIIQDNEVCLKERTQLNRLRAALRTYIDTDISLRYVALVGSFSSGKTATINNLLRLPDGEKRPEDINPVDERLTICAHETKRDSILETLLKSSWDADQFFHGEDDLINLILVDTPGGGDPQVRTDNLHVWHRRLNVTLNKRCNARI
jgi:septin family protein